MTDTENKSDKTKVHGWLLLENILFFSALIFHCFIQCSSYTQIYESGTSIVASGTFGATGMFFLPVVIIASLLLYFKGRTAKYEIVKRTGIAVLVFDILLSVVSVVMILPLWFWDWGTFLCCFVIFAASWFYYEEITIRIEQSKKGIEPEMKTIHTAPLSGEHKKQEAYTMASAGHQSQDTEPAALVDINRCSAEELADLPGISVVTAKKIIEYREQNGYFESVDDFIIKAGIKPHFAIKLMDRLTVSAPQENAVREKKRFRKLDI